MSQTKGNRKVVNSLMRHTLSSLSQRHIASSFLVFVDEVDEGLARLHNGRAEGPQCFAF